MSSELLDRPTHHRSERSWEAISHGKNPVTSTIPVPAQTADVWDWMKEVDEEICTSPYSLFPSPPTGPSRQRVVKTRSSSSELYSQRAQFPHVSVQKLDSLDADDKDIVERSRSRIWKRRGALIPEAEQPLLYRTTPRIHRRGVQSARTQPHCVNDFQDGNSAREKGSKTLVKKLKMSGLNWRVLGGEANTSRSCEEEGVEREITRKELVCQKCRARNEEPILGVNEPMEVDQSRDHRKERKSSGWRKRVVGCFRHE